MHSDPAHDTSRILIELALAEDIGSGDVTAEYFIPADRQARTFVTARSEGVVSGTALAAGVFQQVDPSLQVEVLIPDGSRVTAGALLISVAGRARSIVTAERTALNFLQRLSGVATLTALYVDLVKGTSARILDTRKTTPGYRWLEKRAVVDGGGTNHRMGLHDRAMVKDNHLAALAGAAPNPVAAAVQRARQLYPGLRVEVEADTVDQVRLAVEAGADIILLDNMPPAVLREAVTLVSGRAQTEASGGVNLSTVRAIAETGVDFISVGAITHSARSVDLGLDFA